MLTTLYASWDILFIIPNAKLIEYCPAIVKNL